MRNEQECNEKGVKVSILFTESTSSFLNLEVPYLEDLHSSDTTACVISQSETSYKKPIRCAADIRHRNRWKDWDCKISSDIGFFTDEMRSSETLFDDLSNIKLNSEASMPRHTESLPYILKPRRIHTRPLVTVRSIAHADTLKTYSSKIVISLLDLEAETSAEYMCRICHGGDSFEDLLTPCRCRGTVALAHLHCLERWLRESAHSYCELCQHHYQIIREPRYTFFWSIIVFLRHPGENLTELLFDLFSFIVYTPSAIASNYMLLVLCESIAKYNLDTRSTVSSHVMAFTALFGIAAIDFTYTSWLFTTIDKYVDAWSEWYRNNCTLKVILPRTKLRPHRPKRKV